MTTWVLFFFFYSFSYTNHFSYLSRNHKGTPALKLVPNSIEKNKNHNFHKPWFSRTFDYARLDRILVQLNYCENPTLDTSKLFVNERNCYIIIPSQSKHKFNHPISPSGVLVLIEILFITILYSSRNVEPHPDHQGIIKMW